MSSSIVYKRAATPEELEQIERLNYSTFALELGQHPCNDTGRLHDRFHEANVYFVALQQGNVVGMVAVHDQPPYSICKRLPDPSVLDRLPGTKLEVRLLAIHPAYRNRMMFAGLLSMVFDYARAFDWLLISGAEERIGLYREMGFQQLGPPVPDGHAAFAPMSMRVAEMPAKIVRDAARWVRRSGERQ